jgi:hypothetical protein
MSKLLGDNNYVAKARYIENPLTEAFRICLGSFVCAGSVLRIERITNNSCPAIKINEIVTHNSKNANNYSKANASKYNI